MKRKRIRTGAGLRLVMSSAGLFVALEPVAAERDHKGKRPQIKRQLNLGSPELGATRDKYQAWQRGVVEGKSFYSTKERALMSKHGRINEALRDALVEDRVSESEGRAFFEELYATGEKAQSLRGESDELTKKTREELTGELEALEKRIRSAVSKPMNAKSATPQLNRIQLATEDLVLFGKSAEALSKGKVATVERKVASLAEDEKGAKADGEITDRERENLIEDAQEIFRDLADDLKG